MNIQVFGKKKCFNTQKTERYFKERNIKYQFIDILRFGLSKGELKSVSSAVGINNMIDTDKKEYLLLNMNMIGSANIREEILTDNPVLFKTPIVRNGKNATIGYCPEVWKNWE
jgi:arsenate reductase (glutaredoxin)